MKINEYIKPLIPPGTRRAPRGSLGPQAHPGNPKEEPKGTPGNQKEPKGTEP